jgi:AraC-like DNA-binding protein
MVMSRLARPDPLARVRAYALALAETEGHTGTQSPDLCLYRFSRPTEFFKTATFGVTLGVVLQGEKQMRIEGHALTADPERMLVITRDIEYQSLATQATEERPYLGLSLLFTPERVARALLAFAEAGGAAAPETMPAFLLPLDVHIVDAIERLLRTLDDPLDRTLIAPLILDEILIRLLRSDAAAAVRAGVGPPQDATRILEVMQFIRANHTRKLSVDSLAHQVAMSPSHFAHRFTAVARVSPMRYVREVRLERARALLGEHGARAGDVASRVGFESPAHFAREFKRRFGTPPSQYRAGPS